MFHSLQANNSRTNGNNIAVVTINQAQETFSTLISCRAVLPTLTTRSEILCNSLTLSDQPSQQAQPQLQKKWKKIFTIV